MDRQPRFAHADGMQAPREAPRFARSLRWLGFASAALALIAVLGVVFVPPARLMATYAVLSRVELSHFVVDGTTVTMTGAVNGRTPDAFSQLLDENPQVDTLVLAEVTGSIDDRATFEMARSIRRRGLVTVVPEDGLIESGGVDLFIAGTGRMVDDDARLGVHEWQGFTSRATDFGADHSEHDDYVEFYREMLGSDEFYWFTISAAPPDGMHHLTEAEIEQFGLTTETG